MSGRALGLDVARTKIERIGGTVDLAARPGTRNDGASADPDGTCVVPVLGQDAHR